MRMKQLTILFVCAFILFGCSTGNVNDQDGAGQQAESNEADVTAMQAEIDSLKEQLANQESNSGQTKEESEEEGKEDIDDLANRYKVYIEDHAKDFDRTKVAFVELNGNTPVLLYVDQNGLKGLLQFDGKKTGSFESALGAADSFETTRFNGRVDNIDNTGVKLVFCYREKENRFALYKYEPGDISIEENNEFFEINEVNKLVEVECARKTQYMPNGKVDRTDFYVLSELSFTNRENYDEANERNYEGLDKTIDLINDTYETVDEAAEAYKNEK